MSVSHPLAAEPRCILLDLCGNESVFSAQGLHGSQDSVGLAPCPWVTCIAHLFHTEHSPKCTSSAEITPYFISVSSPAQRGKQLSHFLPFVDSLKGGVHIPGQVYEGQGWPHLLWGRVSLLLIVYSRLVSLGILSSLGPSHCKSLATTDVHTGFSTDSEDSKSGTRGCTGDALLPSHRLSPSSCLPICVMETNELHTQQQ